MKPNSLFSAFCLVLGAALCGRNVAAEVPRPYGLDARPPAKPWLQMPSHTNAEPPALLSQTGAFADTRNLVPSSGLIPYDLNVSFWSDGAAKSRWASIPQDAKIKFAPAGEWSFPDGTVFVKHFELPVDETRPEIKHRLETRLLLRSANGGVYGVTYKWRADNSDADLLTTNLTEDILIKTASGTRTQTWYYPSRQDCLTCHTPLAGGVLGVKTRQLNRDLTYPGGVTDNQLRTWNHLGLFEPKLDEAALPTFTKLASADDKTRSLEDRARSYLDANCAHCHRPGGTVAYFDARYDTPLARQGLIEGQILINQGVDHARVIAPNDIWRSILFMRVNTVDSVRMPPLARETVDRQSVALLREWIESLGGPPVLPPPEFSSKSIVHGGPIEVTLKSEPGAEIHYTLDGSIPNQSDPIYKTPVKLVTSATLRARAFKSGYTKSITTQETFLIGE